MPYVESNGVRCAHDGKDYDDELMALDFVRLRMSADLPYRPNVGIALFNAAGRVFIARRFKDDGPEIILPGLEWQMPQGGIDPDEDPRPAAVRELYEETGVTSRQSISARRRTG